MRLVFVIPYFYPAWQYGGQPRSCYELARILVRRGHFVKVLTTDSGGESRIKGPTGEPVCVEGIEVYYYRNLSNCLAYRHRIFWPAGFFRGIDKQLQGCDVAHIHELRSTLTVAAFQALRRRNLPYVLSTHGGLRHLGKERLKRGFDRLYGQSILKHASILAAVSPREETEALAFQVQPDRIRLLPNLILAEDYANLPPPGGFRSQWSVKAKNLVLFLGRLHWIKGPDLLIQAFTRLLRETDNVHLAIAGPDDGQEAELRRMVFNNEIQNRVTFTGFLAHEAKLRALRDSDVLVIPSRSEVFAIAALEALMCGTPVLISSACGFEPRPTSECRMRQFETENVSDLQQSISRILREDIKPNIESCRKFVVREFSARSVAERAEALYREAIASQVNP